MVKRRGILGANKAVSGAQMRGVSGEVERTSVWIELLLRRHCKTRLQYELSCIRRFSTLWLVYGDESHRRPLLARRLHQCSATQRTERAEFRCHSSKQALRKLNVYINEPRSEIRRGAKYDLVHLGADFGTFWLAMSTAEKTREP